MKRKYYKVAGRKIDRIDIQNGVYIILIFAVVMLAYFIGMYDMDQIAKVREACYDCVGLCKALNPIHNQSTLDELLQNYNGLNISNI